jgi:hypothetical protein
MHQSLSCTLLASALLLTITASVPAQENPKKPCPDSPIWIEPTDPYVIPDGKKVSRRTPRILMTSM